MNERKVFVFVSLVITVLFFNVITAKAKFIIDKSDIPLDTECCDLSHPINLLTECKDAAQAGDWNPGKWGNLEKTKWTPPFAGLKVSQDRSATIRFVISEEELAFYSSTFPNTNTRIPYSLEINVVDYNGM